MNKHYLEILGKIKKNAGKKKTQHQEFGKKYLGTNKIYYCISIGNIKKIAKDFLQKHENLSFDDYLSLLNSLYEKGKSTDELMTAAKIVELSNKLRKQLEPKVLDNWLSYVEGWAEVDVLCQSNFKAEEILANWDKWKKLILNFSKDENVHKRRASLVLLTMSSRNTTDKRLADLAFANIEKLKGEKDILITKAISWLLRSLIKNHKKEVKTYLEKNKKTLPSIAVRETTRKLLTGKK